MNVNRSSDFLGICFSKQCKENKQKEKDAQIAFAQAQADALAALGQSINSPDSGADIPQKLLYGSVAIAGIILIVSIIKP